MATLLATAWLSYCWFAMRWELGGDEAGRVNIHRRYTIRDRFRFRVQSRFAETGFAETRFAKTHFAKSLKST